MGDEELDKEEVERLKREKRYKMRRALAAAGEAGMQGSEDEREEEADEDFIHLDGERRGTGRRHVEEVSWFGGSSCVCLLVGAAEWGKEPG